MGSIQLREKLMQIRRVFVEHAAKPDETIVLNPAEHHYTARVMRLKKGQSIELISPAGCMNATLESISAKQTTVRILSLPEIKNEPSVPITLFQGIPDHLEKLELITQKSVELGVSRIVTFTSRYTDAKYRKLDITKKMERIQKISKEAVRQCGRTRIPQVTGPVPFQELENETGQLDTVFLFFEKKMEKTQFRQKFTPGTLGIIVGPEGGFSDKEAEQLTKSGNIPIHLPSRILRTETAAIACLTLIQAKFGDYSNVF
ncbi:MAG: 16S rRNA (uracil(1498)-N(3))-methyltransferase [Acidobacteria bacterium]|nr:16S rRNA (uracil(1498)-N(3))-methyltransferase [Acidobacteriota bacterium]